MMELTDKNVNDVLDELRPYIESDGGYLEFVAIDYLKDGPIVMVRMLGACAGCAMSAQTLTMGIERKIQEVWPEVTQVISV
jgi:Fe-S cluster biogenesis protein NfuA